MGPKLRLQFLQLHSPIISLRRSHQRSIACYLTFQQPPLTYSTVLEHMKGLLLLQDMFWFFSDFFLQPQIPRCFKSSSRSSICSFWSTKDIGKMQNFTHVWASWPPCQKVMKWLFKHGRKGQPKIELLTGYGYLSIYIFLQLIISFKTSPHDLCSCKHYGTVYFKVKYRSNEVVQVSTLLCASYYASFLCLH